MFTNLKNKLIEEVKTSKFQQFANAAQAAVSSSSNATSSGSETTASVVTPNENFFSITEDDTPQNTPMRTTKSNPTTSAPRNNVIQSNSNNGTGTIPRTRKLSNSSMASDMSFRLPSYDAGSMYHLQSDVEESSSEIGDAASTVAKLDVVTKEQLLEAYRKSLDRYHKYRCRYTDLSKKYKDLERDSSKARSVLVETQEKAIRRINELREQCALEQEAKAHLEEALRVEMDDMQCKMQAYQIKLKLLGENPDTIATALEAVSMNSNKDSLINLNDDNVPSNNVNVNHQVQDEAKINELEQRLEGKQQEIMELNNKLEIMRKQEEENVLLLAQTKAAIHSELENKESEVKNLTENLKKLQNELQTAINREQQTKASAEELNDVKEKLKQSQIMRQEAEAKIIATEHLLNEHKERLSSKDQIIGNLQEKLNNAAKANEEKMKKLREQNAQLQQQQSEEVEKLQSNLQQQEHLLERLREDSKQREEQAEREKSDLRKQVNNILNDISHMEEEMRLVQQSHHQLEAEKRTLEERIETMQQQSYDGNTENMLWQELVNQTEQKLRDTEAKLQNVESEHTQLAEKNCLLEENTHRLEKLLNEKGRHQRQQVTDDALISELHLKLETTETSMQKLTEKMSNILDENSRLHNNQELNDHDYRTLQDKYDALEKEKHGSDDRKQCLEREVVAVKQQLTAEIDQNKELQLRLQQQSENLLRMQREEEQQRNKQQVEQLQQQLETFTNLEDNLKEVQEMLKEKEMSLSQMEREFTELKEKHENEIKHMGDENTKLTQQIKNLTKEQQTRQMDKDLWEKEKIQLLQQQQAAYVEDISKRDQELEKYKNELKQNELLQQESQQQLDAVNTQLKEIITEREKLLEMTISLKHQLKETQEKYENIQESVNQRNEQLQLECEYLNKHVKQLEAELGEHNDNMQHKAMDSEELREKLKSLQCELYVLKGKAEQHEQAERDKEKSLLESQTQIKHLTQQLEETKLELQRQTDHVKYITEQDDAMKSDLIKSQQKLKDCETNYNNVTRELEDAKCLANKREEEYKQQITDIHRELDNSKEELLQQMAHLREELQQKQQLEEEINKFKQDFNEELRKESMTKTSTGSCSPSSRNFLIPQEQADNLRKINATLQKELENLQHKSNAEILGMHQEMEELQNANKQMAERIMDLERLRAGLQAQKLFGLDHNQDNITTMEINDNLPTDKEELEEKLKVIMTEVQDVSNRNLFLEQKCENYLILEQSNERLKLQNAKLSRQLDETLVSLQHCDGAAVNTEFEYLRNIMFQYLTGTANGNNETLVKVISAVLKFSPQQTQVALEKEHQRRSLLNKIL